VIDAAPATMERFSTRRHHRIDREKRPRRVPEHHFDPIGPANVLASGRASFRTTAEVPFLSMHRPVIASIPVRPASRPVPVKTSRGAAGLPGLE